MRIIQFFIIFALAIFNAPLAAADAPSAYDFMKPAKNTNLVISPSGRYIAFNQVITDKYCLDKYGQMKDKEKSCKSKNKVFRSTYRIVIYDLETSKHVKILPAPDNNYLGWLDFASDDRLLAQIGTRTTIGKSGRAWSVGSSRVISIPVDPNDKDFVMLFSSEKGVQRTNRSLTRVSNMLRDDPNHVMMPARKGGDLDLWKVNILTGEATRTAIGTSGTFFWYTSKKGKPMLRYDCVGKSCRKIRVFAPDSSTGAWKKIREVKIKDDESFKDSAFYPAALTSNDNEVIIVSDEDSDQRKSIKVYNLETDSYTKTLYEHPKMDVGGVLTSTSTGEYMGAWLYNDRLEYHIEDQRLQKHFNGLQKYFDNEANIRLIGYNKAGTQSLVYVSAHNTPGVYYLYDFNAKKIDALFSSEPDIENNISAGGRVMEIPMRDGKSISAYHYYPQGKMSGAPLLVMPHGGPHVRDVFDFDYYVQYFVARGYQVVQMNFRGSSGYGKSYEEAGYGEWGGLMQDDITDTVKHFHSSGLASPNKTCIVGYSYGGYAALYGGATTPELYKCIVSGGGVADLVMSMKDDKGNLNEETYDFMKESMGDPKTERAKLDARSPLQMAEKFQDPVLLIHGKWDGRVEYHHSKKMDKALSKAGKNVTFVTLEEEGHSNWDLETEILYLETIESFLNQHLPR